MPLNIDTTKPFKKPSQQLALVRAVVGALPEEEEEWLEWKSSPVLSDKGGRGHLARHILGMANRDPDRAVQVAEGYAYIVVGAEPGKLSGVKPIEFALLEDSLAPYLGGEGPQWSPSYVEDQGKRVLVLAVDPPRWGDRSYLLGRELGKYPPGSVFVRRKGATHLANVAEHRRLEYRLLRSANRMRLEVLWSDGQPDVTPVDLDDHTSLQNWLDQERAALLHPLEQEPTDASPSIKKFEVDPDKKGMTLADLRKFDRKQQTGEPLTAEEKDRLSEASKAFAKLGRTIASSVIRPRTVEDRTRETYVEEVEDYLAKLTEAALPRAASEAARRRLGELRLRVVNPTERNLADVELEVSISGRVFAFHEDDDHVELPPRPRPWGSGRPLPWEFPSFDPLVIPDPRDSDPIIGIQIDHGPPEIIRFDLGDLRPYDKYDLDPVFLLVAASHAGSELLASWRATAKNADGLAEGRLPIKVSSSSTTLRELLEAAEVGEDERDAL